MSKIPRIGILGGSFNPVHNGHLNLAESALQKLKLDKVIFVPAYVSPHKKFPKKTLINDRVNMVRAAVKGNRRFGISMFEASRKGRSYSINTIRYLRKICGVRTGLYFIIGEDSVKGLMKWKDIEKMSKIVEFVAFTRPGFKWDDSPAFVRKMVIKGVDVSSTEIRNAVKAGRCIKNKVPAVVARYIKRHGLYI